MKLLLFICIIVSASTAYTEDICSDSQTRCEGNNFTGCCPLPNATCCPDGTHCCPQNTTCNLTTLQCDAPNAIISVNLKDNTWTVQHDSTNVKLTEKASFFVCPNEMICVFGWSCCPTWSGGYRCCPYPNGVCCNDEENCCPAGTTCDLISETCV